MGKQVIYNRDLRNHLIIDEDGMITVKVDGTVNTGIDTTPINEIIGVNEDKSVNVKVINPVDSNAIREAIENGMKNLNIEGIEVNVDTMVLSYSFKGNTSETYTLDKDCYAMVVSNDSHEYGESLTVTVNGLSIDVLPGEVFNSEFDKFTTVEITNPLSVDYRLLLKTKVAGENV